MMIKYFFFLVAIGLTSVLSAWQDTGHMIVAEVARQELRGETLERCEEILSHFAADFPESDSFVTAACFADDIVSMGLASSKLWHGMHAPYDPEGIIAVDRPATKANLVNGIRLSAKVLSDPTSNRWAKCFSLRMLMHYLGDIHEPLHCAQLYSSRFPEGDSTGRLFKINHATRPNLHKLWDSAFDLHPEKIKRPLSSEDQLWLSDTAANLRAIYPRVDEASYDPELWSQESYRLAVEVAYADIEPGEAPSEMYMTRGQDAALRQLTLAGYRLAFLLEESLGN